MSTVLSSKGQIVIPKKVRQALGLRTGARFHVGLREGKIVLDPLSAPPIEALYGKYQAVDLLAELEAEHRQELEDEEAVRA